MKIKDKSLPCYKSRTDSVFVTSSQLEAVRGEQWVTSKPLSKCFPCKSFVSLRVWTMNRLLMTSDEIWNYLIFMSRNAWHVRCQCALDTRSLPSLCRLGESRSCQSCNLEEENHLHPTIQRLIFSAHCTMTLRQSNNVRAITLLDNRLLQNSIYFYYQQRSFHLKF